MTDTNTDIENVLMEPETVIEATDTSSKKPHRLLVIIVAIFIVFSLMLSGALVYLYQSVISQDAQQQQTVQLLTTRVNAAQQTLLQRLTEEKAAFETQVEQLNQQLLEVQNKNKLYSSDVQALQRRVAETNVRHPNDWILSEVEYLINLSSRKLWLEHDLTTTIALLKAADQRVIEMRDSSLNPLRRALLEDINMIEALPEYDIDSAVLALSSLERRIDKLVIFGLEVPEPQNINETKVSSDIADWKSNLKKSWNTFLENFIVIAHRDVPIEAMLTPKQVWYLKENLRNNLSKAEFAIYHQQQALYDIALNNALQLIAQYYDMTDKSNQHFYQSIESLSKQEIAFTYPDQFKSAPLLARIMKQRLTKSLIEEAE